MAVSPAVFSSPTLLTGPSLLTGQGDYIVLVPIIAFDTDPTVEPPVWTDVRNYVRSVRIRRGRNHELSRMEAGTCTLVLNNRDRRFDPSHTGSPYYPNVKPMRRIRVSAQWDGATYHLFAGYVERWPLIYAGPKDAEVTVEAVDAFEPLAQVKFACNCAEQKSGARVSAILDEIGWPAGDRNIDPGQSTLQAQTLENVVALEHLQAVADSELGVLFIDGAGQVTFRDRHSRLKTPYSESQGTFGDNPTLGELPYKNLVPSYDKDQISNDVQVTREGGTTQTAIDATSIARYFQRTLSRAPLLTTDSEAYSQAHFLLSQRKEPSLRFEAMQLVGRMGADLWAKMLGLDLGDRITIKRTPPGGGDRLVHDALIEAVEYSISDGRQFVTSWRLSPADEQSYWLLGHSTLGVLSETTRLAY